MQEGSLSVRFSEIKIIVRLRDSCLFSSLCLQKGNHLNCRIILPLFRERLSSGSTFEFRFAIVDQKCIVVENGC